MQVLRKFFCETDDINVTLVLMLTFLPAGSAGTAKKCHCKRVSLYPMIFSIRRPFFGPKNGHCSWGVTLTGVTVCGEACTILVLLMFSRGGRQKVVNFLGPLSIFTYLHALQAHEHKTNPLSQS